MREETFAAACAAWPKLRLTPELFAAYAAQHPAATHLTDLYLAFGVLQREPAALAYFEERFVSRVPEFVVRVSVDRSVVDEVQQKLRELLLIGVDGKPPKLSEYSGTGALGGWLRIVAVRTTLNHLRGTATTTRTRELEETDALVADPELGYVKERARALFADAFRRVLAALDENGRTILRLHYLDGLSMDQLAALYKTPRSTIARRVAEARRSILEATAALLREDRRLSPSAVASVLREGRSQLEVTITRLLAPDR